MVLFGRDIRRCLPTGTSGRLFSAVGLLAAALILVSQPFGLAWADNGGQDGSEMSAKYASAIFAGGCFWCVEADFEKLDSVISAVSGYSGGFVDDPTYKQVTDGQTGHLEAVKVYYDPDLTTYRALVDFFLRHIDPLDDGGQFCDRGASYKTAIFAETADERTAALAAIEEAGGVLGKDVVTPVVDRGKFWRAEEYHQDYYKKNRLKYSIYRSGCGRDRRIKQVWGDKAGS